jgi:hypothetical protein
MVAAHPAFAATGLRARLCCSQGQPAPGMLFRAIVSARLAQIAAMRR